MSYVSAEDARSDLFLSGAVYVFGPLLVGALLRVLPIQAIPGVTTVLGLVVPVAVTVLVPLLLIRYRDESLRQFGLGRVDGALVFGLLLAAPIVGAGMAEAVIRGGDGMAASPLLHLRASPVLAVVARLLGWMGVVLLSVYGTVKARDAFSGTVVAVREGMERIGRILGIVLAASGALLLLASLVRGAPLGDTLASLLLPILGFVGSGIVAHRTIGRASTTTLPTLVTPVVLMAIGPFALTLRPEELVVGVFQAALYAILGLVIGVVMETRRNAWVVVGLGLAVGLLTGFGAITLGR